MSLSGIKEAEIIEAFKSTSRYLDDRLNIDNSYLDRMINQIYTSELHLNKTNSSDIEAPFLDLHFTISDKVVSSKFYDKRNDFDFDFAKFPFLGGDITRATSYGVHTSQLILFARVSSDVTDFNTRILKSENFSNKVYYYHNSVKLYQNSIDATK